MNISQNFTVCFRSPHFHGWAARPMLALALCLALGAAVSWSQPCSERVLHSFSPMIKDGAFPYGGPVQGQDGALYGMTWGGGSKAGGTVFRVNADGSEYRVLHSFTNASDGSTPQSGLVQGSDAALYGTAYYGGTKNFGTVFKLNTNGTGYAVLYSFTNSADGAYPRASLIEGRDGALYGTTYMGGASNAGTVFRIKTDGSGYSVLHSFSDRPDGAIPFAGLVQGKDGVLYGTTSAGGDHLGGTVFAINSDGSGYKVLYSFAGLPADGAAPQAGLIQGNDGALYGTTVIAGTKGYGAVFKINTNGSGYAVLHSFTNAPDGANPYGGLAQGGDGALYGTTTWGGNTNAGTVFRLNTDGSGYAVLHHFTEADGDGSLPFAGLIGGENGMFYGTTVNGGRDGFGTVYRLVLAPNLAITLIAQGNLQLTVTGFPAQRCQVQATTNFSHWDTLTELTLTNGVGQFKDPAGTILPLRFYRAVVP